MKTETKVNAAAALLKEAQSTRRRGKPGELVLYHTYKGSEEHCQGEECRLDGFDVIEATRSREPSYLLRKLKRWLFSNEVLMLPRDALYRLRLDRYWAKEDKATS